MRSSDQQHEALLAAFAGDLGGPLADLAGLVDEVVAVERVPITHEAEDALRGPAPSRQASKTSDSGQSAVHHNSSRRPAHNAI